MDLTDFEKQAIPHEAGHIIVGLSEGLAVRGMAAIIYRDQKGTRPGNFITKSKEPTGAAILLTPPPIMSSYKLMVGGGLAGNIVSQVPPANEALQDDRNKLALVGSETLEEMAAIGESIIRRHLEGFLKLIEAIGDRYLELKNDASRGTGEHLLLTAQELKDISGIHVESIFDRLTR